MKYYILDLSPAGFEHISFWKDLDENEALDLEEEHGSLEAAAGCNTPDIGVRWVLPQDEIEKMKKAIDKILT